MTDGPGPTRDPFETAISLLDSGDVDGLRRLLSEHPGLVTGRDGDGATLLIRLTDWPGLRPRAAESARLLLGTGAEADARRAGDQGTPLAAAVSTIMTCTPVSISG